MISNFQTDSSLRSDEDEGTFHVYASPDDIRRVSTLEVRVYTARENGHISKPLSGVGTHEKIVEPLAVLEGNVKGGLHSAWCS